MMDFLHDSSFAQSVSRFAVVFIPAYLGIILHEVGHGWAALREGDPTAKFMGRLTINPLPHIDVLGLVVFIITSISGGFVFGWAKPVPIDPRNFRNPRRGLLTVSLAGPGTNIILAVLFACLLKILLLIDPSIVLMATHRDLRGALASRRCLDQPLPRFLQSAPCPASGRKQGVGLLSPCALRVFLSFH